MHGALSGESDVGRSSPARSSTTAGGGGGGRATGGRGPHLAQWAPGRPGNPIRRILIGRSINQLLALALALHRWTAESQEAAGRSSESWPLWEVRVSRLRALCWRPSLRLAPRRTLVSLAPLLSANQTCEQRANKLGLASQSSLGAR